MMNKLTTNANSTMATPRSSRRVRVRFMIWSCRRNRRGRAEALPGGRSRNGGVDGVEGPTNRPGHRGEGETEDRSNAGGHDGVLHHRDTLIGGLNGDRLRRELLHEV